MLLPMGRCYCRRLAMHTGVAWIPYIWDSTLVGNNSPRTSNLFVASVKKTRFQNKIAKEEQPTQVKNKGPKEEQPILIPNEEEPFLILFLTRSKE